MDKIVNTQEDSLLAPKRRRIRSGQHEDLDAAVLRWFKSVRDKNIPINGKIVQEKALQYARELEVDNFVASDGWLGKWKKRFSIGFQLYLVKVLQLQMKWLLHGGKQHCQPYCRDLK